MAIPENFVCNKDTTTIEKWLQKEDPGACRPCRLRPLAEYYAGALKIAKADDALKKLGDAWETGDGLTIAKTMDSIKNEVGGELKKELTVLDCFTQNYKDLIAKEATI